MKNFDPTNLKKVAEQRRAMLRKIAEQDEAVIAQGKHCQALLHSTSPNDEAGVAALASARTRMDLLQIQAAKLPEELQAICGDLRAEIKTLKSNFATTFNDLHVAEGQRFAEHITLFVSDPGMREEMRRMAFDYLPVCTDLHDVRHFGFAPLSDDSGLDGDVAFALRAIDCLNAYLVKTK
ncbi:hypothetical protein GC207_11305 [bacterium]|nr:hypothetical protein [bacterium]